jgi:hypothetical protein
VRSFERWKRGDHSFPAKEQNIIFHPQKGIIGYMYSNFGAFDIDKALFINYIKNPFEKE